jgi:hypothetical protein
MRKSIALSLLLVLSIALTGCTKDDPYPDPAYFKDIYTYGVKVIGGGVGVEVDPVFTGSPASGITAPEILGWNGHAVLATGVHGVGAGSIVGTTLAQELTNKTLNASVGKGTWTASGVWKLPAMFFNDDITTDRWLSSEDNTVLGVQAMGQDALSHTGAAEGWHNTAIGHHVMSAITTGSYNTGIGTHSLIAITTGISNTALGALSGYSLQTGGYNVFLGAMAGGQEVGSNKLYIDNSDTVTPLIYGDFSTNALTINGTLQTGGAANYTLFAADGTQTMIGTARVEKDVEIPLTAFGKGVAAPATVYIGNYIGYEYTINDTAYFSTEVPYDWDSTSDLEIELHWYIDEAYATAPNGEARWNLIYTATKEDGTEIIDAATATIDSGDINIPATAKRLVQTELAIPAASLQAHDVIGIQVKRVALVGGNDPTAKPTLIGAMIQYISNKLGE